MSTLLLHAAAFAPPTASLAPRAYTPLPVGSVTPTGWLLEQLTLQAEGLSGHLAQFWPDVQQSVWIGGNADGGLHERTPYWLNGIVPLAFLLRNAGRAKLSPVVGVWKAASPSSWLAANRTYCTPEYHRGHGHGHAGHDHAHAGHDHDHAGHHEPTEACVAPQTEQTAMRNVDLLAQVETYVAYILSHQAADGWLGPPQGGDSGAFWGRSNIMLALAMYAEANAADPAKWQNVTGAMRGYALSLGVRLKATPLTSWAAQRWQDIALGVQWLLDHAAGGREAELLRVGDVLHSQGGNWEKWFELGNFSTGGEYSYNPPYVHNVNAAQGLKSAAVRWRQSRNASLRTLSRTRVDKLDAHCGLPTGMYVGDELIDTAAGHSPSRGIELCGVVEAMFSYATMFQAFGEASAAERAERIAYNAMAATWASPKGGDMWAHQYLQAVNEIAAKHDHPHVWKHDGDDAEKYGLAPNFGCCTANFNQGWPKFAHAIFHTTADGAIAIGILAPAKATIPAADGISKPTTIEITTDYPFGDDVTIDVDAAAPTALLVRVPAWADASASPTLTLAGGKPISLAGQNGTLTRLELPAGTSRAVLAFAPPLRVERWSANGYSVHRGALMYSLPLTPNFTVTAHHFGGDDQSNDYDAVAATPWRVAIELDPAAPDKSLRFERRHALAAGAAPWNHTGWPTVVHATVRPLPSWGVVNGSATEPPPSPACAGNATCGDAYDVVLVPHGATDLRIGMLPLA